MLDLESGDRIELFFDDSPATTICATVARLLSDREEGMSPEVEDYTACWIEIVVDQPRDMDAQQVILLGTDSLYRLNGRKVNLRKTPDSFVDDGPIPNLGEEFMSTATASSLQREPQLSGQTVVVIGGSAGIGLETGRRARAAGAHLILTARNPEHVERAARELGAQSSDAFDATDFDRLQRFFHELPSPVDHILVTAGGPYYARLADIDFEQARRNLDHALWLPLHIARSAIGKVRPGGTLVFIGGIGGRRPSASPLVAALTAAVPALIKTLAYELAPIRVNLIAPGFVDTPLSASLLGDQLDARREQLRSTLPIRRVVGPQDIAALAVHLMTNTAITGATYDIDGGQQLVEA